MINFISQKRALGYDYFDSEGYLQKFDQMCLSFFPDETVLTREICSEWAIRKESECINTFRSRLPVIREFARFLNRNGESAYVLPVNFAPRAERHIPYIYTEDEISKLWSVFDNIKPCKNHPARHIVIPAVMRLLYCCGLRPCEARRLRTENVDFEHGRLEILESKGHKNRIIMMSDDLNEYLRIYDCKVKMIFPGREVFFPNSQGKTASNKWLVRAFQNACTETGLCQLGDYEPRIYDFRHTFATHRLYKWMNEGKNIASKLSYLRAYMGHELLSATHYYIHLVPGLYEKMSGFDYGSFENLLPEVECDE
jgi:integrase